jgi:hypothetical protein
VNILPLIFTFLIIFACLAFTFLREVKSFFLSETIINSLYHTERVMNNKIAYKTYRKIKTEAIHKKGSDTQKSSSSYYSRRSFYPPFEDSKFNLGPLIQYEGECKLHPLFEPFAEILRLLYKKTLFATQPHSGKIEYRLIEAILAKSRKVPEVKNLSELYPDDSALAALYYKMLKGTNQYNQKKSIPPLGDFVTLQKEPVAIFFSFASPVLLQAFFTHEIAEHILEEERKLWEKSNKYQCFSKEDLQSLLMKNPILAAKYSSLESYFSYSKQFKTRSEIGGIDSNTGLSMKKHSSRL